jgi:DNA polymerase I-like protein with 3'-5' exonuclease and polymerase domains
MDAIVLTKQAYLCIKEATMNKSGNLDNPNVLAVFDPPPQAAWDSGNVTTPACMRVFRDAATGCGFGKDDFAFICCAPPLPADAVSEKRIADYLALHREEFLREYGLLANKTNLVMYFGNMSGRMVEGHAVKITQARGKIVEVRGNRVLPMLSAGNILRRPEQADVFKSDFRMAAAFRDNGWQVSDAVNESGRNYRWCLDLEDEIDLDDPPRGMGFDTETVGGRWYDKQARILTMQLSWKDGDAIVIPLDIGWWNDPALMDETTEKLPRLTPRTRMKLIHQLRKLFKTENGVKVCGANPKYDMHFGENIKVEPYVLHDVCQLAFVIDDNMQEKSLNECVRRWLPTYAGYADKFDRETDKSHMEKVPHGKLLPYAAADADAVRQATKVMVNLAKQDAGNYGCYVKVQMPALRMFQRMERVGLRMSTERLSELVRTAGEQELALRTSLISRIDPKMKRKLLEDNADPETAFSFSRDVVVRQILFSKRSEGGRGHKPQVFTKGTAKLPPSERIPSCSAKDHLVYFEEDDWVSDLMDYKRLQKLRSTYIGQPADTVYMPAKLLKSGKSYTKNVQTELDKSGEEIRYEDGYTEPQGVLRQIAGDLFLDSAGLPWIRKAQEASGFWSHLSDQDRLHTSFILHRTVTGRAASASPNLQNVAKRGKTEYINTVVQAYRRCFVPTNGYRLIEVDLSQAEIRVVAWAANERTMLGIYERDGDIHETTGAAVMRISVEKFRALDKDVRKMKRFQAKGVTFGNLYDSSWKGFQRYMKVEFGINYSDVEAQEAQAAFFSLYSGLKPWHAGVKQFVNQHGYVRSLHGALRRLPSINSDDDAMKAACERQAINSPIQRFASDIGLIGMTRFGEGSDWDIQRPIGFIHDAVVAEARIGYEEQAARELIYCMETVPLQEMFGITPPLPIRAEASIGDNLADMEERPELTGLKPEWL